MPQIEVIPKDHVLQYLPEPDATLFTSYSLLLFFTIFDLKTETSLKDAVSWVPIQLSRTLINCMQILKFIL